MKTAAFTVLLSTAVSAQAQKPTTGYAPVNGLKMYYEIHGSGSSEPLVLLHGSFMTITNNWTGWIGELSKSRTVIAVEMQGHGRTADINRDFSYEDLADDVAAMLDYLKIEQADLLGYSMGGGVAMQAAIRHPEKVRKRSFPKLTADTFRGSPIETEYKKLSPTPNEFPNFVKCVIAMELKPYDFGADRLEATKAPFLFIHGDADGVRLDHIAEMFRLKGDEIHGDLRPRSESRLAVLPNATHVTLMEKGNAIIPMVNDFLDAKLQKKWRPRHPGFTGRFLRLARLGRGVSSLRGHLSPYVGQKANTACPSREAAFQWSARPQQGLPTAPGRDRRHSRPPKPECCAGCVAVLVKPPTQRAALALIQGRPGVAWKPSYSR